MSKLSKPIQLYSLKQKQQYSVLHENICPKCGEKMTVESNAEGATWECECGIVVCL